MPQASTAHTLRRPRFRVVSLCPNTILSLVVLSSLVFVAQLGSLSALTFLIAGLVLVLRHPQATLDETRLYLWIYVVPAWCLMSYFWSAYPGLTLRYGVQLTITFAVAITMAHRLSPIRMLKLVFVAFALSALFSVLAGRVRFDGVWIGIFGSKNAFASAMSLFVLASMALLIDTRLQRGWRTAAFAGFIAGLVLLAKAEGVGSLVITVIAIGATLLLMWLKRFSPTHKLVLGVLGLLAAAVLVLGILTFRAEVAALVLDLTGKDATLTGRLDLWEVAFGQIALHPWLGQGYQAVWVIGNPIAEDMWEMFGISTKTGFHFHNTLISNAVEIGIIGVALQAAVFMTGVVLTLAWALHRPTAESLFFAVLMLRHLMLGLLEVQVFFQFDIGTVLPLCALVYGLRAMRQRKQTALVQRQRFVSRRATRPADLTHPASA